LHDAGAPVSLRRYGQQVWAHREFAMMVPLGQLRARSQDTVLGRAWYLLNPLLLIGVYYLIFEVALGIEERGGVEDFLPFLTVGVITYAYTRGTVQSGATSILSNRRLVHTLGFPRVILPFGVLVAQTSTHLYAAAAMLLLVLPMGVTPTWRWGLLPVVVALHAVMNLGLALFAARLTFHFPDVANFLPFALRLGLYASGVIIPINATLIPASGLRTVLQTNPLYTIIDVHRQLILDAPLDARSWVLSVVWAGLFLVVGLQYFRRAESRYSNA
jgi:teichoic acid transport system permease protein